MRYRVTVQDARVVERTYEVEATDEDEATETFYAEHGDDMQPIRTATIRSNWEVVGVEPGPVQEKGIAAAVATIERLRRDDSDFITVETVVAYTLCHPSEARAAIVRVFGQDWLDRQDAAAINRGEHGP
jgi:hypothetical protein